MKVLDKILYLIACFLTGLLAGSFITGNNLWKISLPIILMLILLK